MFKKYNVKRIMMKKLYKFIFFLFIFLTFASCDFSLLEKPGFNNGTKEFLEYWTSTCQVADIEYASAHTEMKGVANVSAAEEIEIYLNVINPKSYNLLQNTKKWLGASCACSLDQALLIAGVEIKEPSKFVASLNNLLSK